MNTGVDEYRVSLFKKKLRAELPEIGGLRFGRSKGRCQLIIEPWRYNDGAAVIQYVSERLSQERIEFHPMKMFNWSECWDYIRIPIDQAALPERRRHSKNATASRFAEFI